jgi:ubiquinone/menaquinone biosynthesis C-methylase UbiE
MNLLDVDLSLVKNILELGSGAGAFAQTLLLRWPHLNIIGVDYSPTMVNISNERVDGRFFVHDLSDPLPFSDMQFDFVIMWSTLFYLKPSVIISLLWEVKRVSRNGMFIGDVSDARKRDIADIMRKQTHGHLSNPSLTHTYIKPKLFLEWASGANYWARFSDEDSIAGKYEQAKYRFSVVLIPLDRNIENTFWEADPSSTGSVCAQPPFTREHLRLSAGFACPYMKPFYDFSLEKIESNIQLRISGWRQGCLFSSGKVSLQLFNVKAKLSGPSQSKGLIRSYNESEMASFESEGFVLPPDVSYATIECAIIGRPHNFNRKGVIANTPYYLNSLPTTSPDAKQHKHSVFYLQLDAISRAQMRIELPRLFEFLTSLGLLDDAEIIEFPNMMINGQNTEPNWISGLCNGNCESSSLFDLAKQNGYRTLYFNNYCPLYPFPWKGGASGDGPDVTLLSELNCMEGDAGWPAPCRTHEDAASKTALVTLFDTVIHSAETGPIFAFGTLNDGHCEDISKLIRMEELIIQKIRELLSSSWFKLGGVFILGSDHGLHYWNGVSIDLHLKTPYAFLDTPPVSFHRNPPLFVAFGSLSGLKVQPNNIDAIIRHYDVYHTVKALIGFTSDSAQNLFSETRIDSRSCSSVDSTFRYCNCWRQCLPNGSSITPEKNFSAKMQGLKPCMT